METLVCFFQCNAFGIEKAFNSPIFLMGYIQLFDRILENKPQLKKLNVQAGLRTLHEAGPELQRTISTDLEVMMAQEAMQQVISHWTFDLEVIMIIKAKKWVICLLIFSGLKS